MNSAFYRDLEQLIWQIATQVYGGHLQERASIVSAIKELSALYTAERTGPLPPVPESPHHDLARLLFFTVADLPKVAYPLTELIGSGHLAGRAAPMEILDIGAGFGAQALGTIGLIDPPGSSTVTTEGRIELDAIDRDPRPLELLQRILGSCQEATGYGRRVSLRIRQHEIQPGGSGKIPLDRSYDLILAGTLLNELDPADHLALTRGLLEALKPEGHLIVIEPSLRHTSRSLHTLRDELLASSEPPSVFAPCTHHDPCPALVNPKDWCHEHRACISPPELAALTGLTGLRRWGLKWSYLTLNRCGARPKLGKPGAWRVVSRPIKSKGKLELFLCGAAGRIRASRLKRHRTPANAAFAELDRGCWAWIDGAKQTAGGLRVGPECVVSYEDPGLASSVSEL
jgi:hypothetical protein